MNTEEIMTQRERLRFLIQYLIEENPEYSRLDIPDSEREQKRLLRSLMNVRPPGPAAKEFMEVQDRYLSRENGRNPVSLTDMQPIQKNIWLWQGDITALRVDAIVNAANSALLGCFIPCHGCIDNAIHSAAGIQLRLECFQMMRRQGKEEPTGAAKITKAYNLPCRYVLHTVGPVVTGEVTETDCRFLAACYRSCLELAEKNGLKSVAFCCISTGEYRFPNELAAQIAIAAVKSYQKEHDEIKVIFDVFKDTDFSIYQRLLGKD